MTWRADGKTAQERRAAIERELAAYFALAPEWKLDKIKAGYEDRLMNKNKASALIGQTKATRKRAERQLRIRKAERPSKADRDKAKHG